MLQSRRARVKLYCGMIRSLCVWLTLAGLVLWTGAADQIVAQETQKASAALASPSNVPSATEIPQLSANPASEAEIQSRRILPLAPSTNAVAAPVKRTVPQIQSVTFFVIGGMIAFLVIVAVTGRRPKQ
jgi:hypothetical protein